MKKLTACFPQGHLNSYPYTVTQRLFTAFQNTVNDVAVYDDDDDNGILDVNMRQHNTHHESQQYRLSLRFKENLPTN